MIKHEWLLKRNCSLTPRQSAVAIAGQGALLLALSAPFALQGAWVVLAFASAEIAALATAFLHYARHASDREHIQLMDKDLLVSKVEAGKVEQIRFDPRWLTIVLPENYGDLIRLESGRANVQIGRFIAPAKRRQFAEELKRKIGSVAAEYNPAPQG